MKCSLAKSDVIPPGSFGSTQVSPLCWTSLNNLPREVPQRQSNQMHKGPQRLYTEVPLDRQTLKTSLRLSPPLGGNSVWSP